MNVPRFAVRRRTVVLVAAVLALVAGLRTFATMSRREDPKILIRSALVETRWPGAAARKVEELVTEPLEDAVYGIEAVKELESTSRIGYSRIEVVLEDEITEVDQTWDEVRARVREAQGDLPAGSGEPVVNADFGDVSAVCLALYELLDSDGSAPHYSYRDLEVFAEDLEAALKSVESVAEVTIYGAPREVIALEVDAGQWARLALTREQLADAIDAQNVAAGGAQTTTDAATFPLHPTGELLTVDQIRDVTVSRRADGLPVKLGDLPIKLERGPQDPRPYGVRFAAPGVRAERALLLGITMKAGRNVVEMGAEIDALVEEFARRRLPRDVGITRVNDLPRQVRGLVSGFVTNLWQAIAIVLAVALLMMGWRPALVMASAVPLCMISALGIVALFDVELEQFSIASLIIALGMIVDNAIVVSDNVQRLLDEGRARVEAAVEGAQSLAVPMLSSTLTTVAAFLPMLTISGASGEYMRSLPIVVSTTLLLSYAVALTVTPVACFYVLKPKNRPVRAAADSPTKKGRLGQVYGGAARWCLSHRLPTLGAAAGALAGTLLLVPSIGSQFFPQGLRDQLFVHVTLPEGVSLQATERVVAAVERELLAASPEVVDGERVERLANATSFVGFGGPRLMLTMSPTAAATNSATVLVNTRTPETTDAWAAELRARLRRIPGALIDVRQYQLGPPLSDPIEFRLIGDDLAVLARAGDEMVAAFRETAGTVEPSHDWGNSGYEVELRIDQDRASLAGVAPAGVAATLRDLYGGGHLTTYREGDHQVEVVLRLLREQREDLASLQGIYVEGSAGKVPLASIAEPVTGWRPAVIGRRDKRRTITVGSQVAAGYLPNKVAGAMTPRLEAIADGLPAGTTLELGGEAEETAKSQKNITAALQISMVLIVLVLIAQYDSIAKPFIVLLTVPLSLIGALLGLFLSGWPLGFMPSLGVVSLAGIVINNAIILIDFTESAVRDGAALREAVVQAGSARMKPILLTTLTTIGGLLPLALFGGPMWAGMAYAMIGGLVVSTALTLLVVPTVYVLCVERFGMRAAG